MDKAILTSKEFSFENIPTTPDFFIKSSTIRYTKRLSEKQTGKPSDKYQLHQGGCASSNPSGPTFQNQNTTHVPTCQDKRYTIKGLARTNFLNSSSPHQEAYPGQCIIKGSVRTNFSKIIPGSISVTLGGRRVLSRNTPGPTFLSY